MTKSYSKDRALIWAVNMAVSPLVKIGGISVLQRILDALAVPELEKIGLMVSAQSKSLFESFVSDRVKLIEVDESDFAPAILMAEDQFKNFAGNVLLLTADLPFLNSKQIVHFLQCMHSKQAVGCLLVARTDQPQEYNARIFRDENGNIRRLQVFSEPVDKQNAALEITGFPYLFEWDCLQRALYQILHKQQNPQLTDIVEKITDNGFVVEGLDIENDLPLFRTLDNKSLEKARKILTKENS